MPSTSGIMPSTMASVVRMIGRWRIVLASISA
jgi:hypothetical protein